MKKLYFSRSLFLYMGFLIFFALLISNYIVPIRSIDHQEIDSLSAALSGRDEPFYPRIGYLSLNLVISLFNSKNDIVLFNTIFFSMSFFIVYFMLSKNIFNRNLLSCLALLVLLLNPIFINHFYHIISLSFPIFTILNILLLFFLIKFLESKVKRQQIIYGLLFILTAVLAAHTTLFIYISLFALFISSFIVYSSKIKPILFNYLFIFIVIIFFTFNLFTKLFAYKNTQGSILIPVNTLNDFFSSFQIIIIILVFLFCFSFIFLLKCKEFIFPRKKVQFISLYLLILLSIFFVLYFFVEFDAPRIMSFMLPLLYLYLFNINRVIFPKKYYLKITLVLVLILFLPSLMFSYLNLTNEILRINQEIEFHEYVFSELNSTDIDVIIFSPYTLFYDYIEYFNLSTYDLLDDNMDPIILQKFNDNATYLTNYNLEFDDYDFYFTNKIFDLDSQKNYFDIDYPFYLLQDLNYISYYSSSYLESNCEIIGINDKIIFYLCSA